MVGVVKVLRVDGLRKADDISSALGEMADSAIGVTPAAIGVCPPSLLEKNLAFEFCSPNEVMSLKEDVLAMLRWGPRLRPGGDKGGLRISGMVGLAVIVVLMFGKVICWADGDVHGSDDSFSVQAKLIAHQYSSRYK